MTKPAAPPWQTHSVKTQYDNPWITVTHREVTAPTGQAGIYGVVHFKNLAVGIVPLDADGNTWLVGQHRYTLDDYTWEIPEGGGALDVDPLITAQRELREETGITAARWTPLMNMHTSNSVTDERAVSFVAQDLEFGTVQPDDTEILEIRKVPLATAVDMALDGRITDSLAVISLLKLQLLLDRGMLSI